MGEHINVEHVEVASDFCDAQVAETFLHHRMLILPVVDAGHVTGVILGVRVLHRAAGRPRVGRRTEPPRNIIRFPRATWYAAGADDSLSP